MAIRAPQLENDFQGNGDGGKTSQNDPLRLGPGTFGSKLMDLDGLKVSHFGTSHPVEPSNKVRN